ncbi:MAG: hypothetical protein JNL90_14440 [Planctomycetes bacterium]|nr:hypothetical protein [Planctomycetota bacterium]
MAEPRAAVVADAARVELGASPPSDPISEPTLTLVTVKLQIVARSDRAPVASARVEVWSDGASEPTVGGLSDREGRLEFPLPRESLAIAKARVRAERFALHEEPLAPHVAAIEAGEIVVVELAAGGVLEGNVVRHDGTPGPQGMKVAAWRPTVGIDAPTLFAPSSDWSHCRIVETDEAGRFRFDGLVEGSVYRLEAGGRGLVSDGFAAKARVPEVAARIEVAPLYACVVELVERGGGPLRAGPLISGWIDGFELDGGISAEPVNCDRLLTLASLPPRAALLGDRPSTLLMYRASPDVASIGPARFHFGVPGYRAAEVEAHLPRVVDSIERFTFELEPLGQNDFGDVVIRFSDLLAWNGGSPRDGQLLGTLGMRPFEAGVPYFTVPLRFAGDERVEIRGLPFGRYLWFFHSAGSLFQLPNRDHPALLECTVGPRPVELFVPMPRSGTLRLRVRESRGEPFTMPLGLEVRRTGDPPAGTVWMLHPIDAPYRVDAFPGGTWNLLVKPSLHAALGVPRPVAFEGVEIEAGKETLLDVEIVIDPPLEGE